MKGISKSAPAALIICALLSFTAVGIFLTDYYAELFKVRFGTYAMSMAVLVAVISEAVRFSLLVSSIRDFSDNKPFNGWLGIVGSLAMVYHDISTASKLAEYWNITDSSPYFSILTFLILIGLLLEIRLILTVGKDDPINKAKKNRKKSKKKAAKRKKVVHQTDRVPDEMITAGKELVKEKKLNGANKHLLNLSTPSA